MKRELVYELFIPYMGEVGSKFWYFLLRFIAPAAVLFIMINQLFFT